MPSDRDEPAPISAPVSPAPIAEPQKKPEAKAKSDDKTQSKDKAEPKDNDKDKAKPEEKKAKVEIGVPVVIGPKADWSNFTPVNPRTYPRLERLATRTERPRRLFAHEWTLTGVFALAISLFTNRGLLADPVHARPADTGDAATATYLITRAGKTLVEAPGQLFDLSRTLPAGLRADFPDALLGFAPFGLGASGAGGVLRYTIVALVVGVMTFIGPYALVRQLGAGWVAAATAGAAMSFAPWRLGAGGNEPIFATAGLALALAMLARGHDVRWRRPVRDQDRYPDDEPATSEAVRHWRPGWAIGGWLLVAWQITISAAVGGLLTYVVVIGVLICWGTLGLRWLRERTPVPYWLLAVDGLGLALAVLWLVAVLGPYDRRLTSAALVAGSAPPLGLITAPGSDWVWGGVHAAARAGLSDPATMALLPGFALAALAVAGLLISVWSIWTRLALVLGTAVVLILVLGPRGPLSGSMLTDIVRDGPGLAGLVRPRDLIAVATLLLALLAAGAVGGLVTRSVTVAHDRGLRRPTIGAYIGLLLPAVLLIAEGLGSIPTTTVAPSTPAAVHFVQSTEDF